MACVELAADIDIEETDGFICDGVTIDRVPVAMIRVGGSDVGFVNCISLYDILDDAELLKMLTMLDF